MKRIDKLILVITVFTALAACTTKPPRPAPAVGAMQADVGAQDALLQEQAITLGKMRENVKQIKSGIFSAREALQTALSQHDDLVEQFNAIDVFVRKIIEAENQLEELQK
jgi:hypothetical protein